MTSDTKSQLKSVEMKLATAILFFSLCSANAATRYVRAGATGAGTGTDWTDAYSALPTTLVRGDTYYVAGGTYPSYTFTTATSGTTMIYVKKATVASHGTETGWSDSYGTAQAVFQSSFNITRSWFELDGQTRNEADWFSGAAYGFKIQHTGNWIHMVIANGSTFNTNITVKYVYVAAQIGVLPVSGSGISPNNVTTQTYNNSVMNRNLVFSRMFIQGGNQSWHLRQTTGPVVEYSAAELTCGSDAFHGEMVNGFYLYTAGPIVRYCHFRNCYNGASGYPAGGGTGIIALADVTSAEIYGNIFESYLCGDGAIAAGWPNTNIKVYNNTFINGIAPSGALVRFSQSTGAGSVAYNNIAINCSNPTYNGVNYTAANNSTLPTTAVINFAGKDFRLAAATAAGTTLSSTYNQDRLGVTRGADGVWDRGAYEFVSGTSPGDTNIPTVSITAPTNNSVVSNSVSFTANASDDTGVSGVQFYVNNSEIADDTASAYSTTWDTTSYANGVYSIRARARDAAGNFGYSGTNSVSVSNTVAPPAAPVYWPLSENTGTTSTDSGAGNVLTLVGNSVWQSSRIGTGIAFDGTGDYLTAPNSSSLNIGDADFTAACWVKLTNQSTWQQILSKIKVSGAPSTPWHLFVGHNSTTNYTPMFQVANATSNAVNVASAVQVLYGDWVHLTGVYDGANVKIYVNGVLQGTAAQTGNVLQYTQPLYVGATGGPGEYMNGAIDEIRIYDDAFTAAQVLELYQTTPPETSPPQVVIEPVGFELVGQSASSNLTVSVTGTAPLYYQWRRYTTNNVGANTNYHAVSGVANVGDYTVVITNSAGSITSATAAVTIVLPPTVTPLTFTRTNLFVGSMLSIEPATSNGIVNMVWYRGTNLLFGTFATTNRLDMVVGVLDSGIYKAVVTNQAGNAESSSFQVFVYQSSNVTTTVINAGTVRNP